MKQKSLWFVAIMLCFSSVVLLSCSNRVKPSEIAEMEPIPKKPVSTNEKGYAVYTGIFDELTDEKEPARIIIWEKDNLLLARYQEKDYELTAFEEHQYAIKDSRLFDSNSMVFAGILKTKATVCKIGTHLFSRYYAPIENYPPLQEGAVAKQLETTQLYAKDQAFPQRELIPISKKKPSIQFFLRFNTKNNILHEVISPLKTPYLTTQPAEALLKVQDDLEKEGLSLMVYQAYVPWYAEQTYYQLIQSLKIEKAYWELYQKNTFSIGNSVDVGLFDQKSQTLVSFGSEYLDESPEADLSFFGGTSLQRYYKLLLCNTMKKYGFSPYSSKWWGYTFKTKETLSPLNQIPEESNP